MVNERAPATLVGTNSLGGVADTHTASAQLSSEKFAKISLPSDQFTGSPQLSPMALPIVPVPPRPTLQVPKNRIKVSDGLADRPDTHRAPWKRREQSSLRPVQLPFQPVDRMVGHVADGDDQRGVVPQLAMPQFLDFQVVEEASDLVGDGQLRVDVA